MYPRICAVVMIFVTTAAQAQQTVQQCNADTRGEGLLAVTWNQFLQALEKRPTEAQRLSRLRVSFEDLHAANQELISRVQQVVTVGSVPDWLKARVNEIPAVQERVERLLGVITNEAEEGGLLAADPSLGTMREVLNFKRTKTLCELSNIPIPLPTAQLANVKKLLEELNAEQDAIGKLDDALAAMIRKAQSTGATTS